jgi:hypothetical protein
MLTPLSISPYNSRFSLATDLLIYNDTYNYVNMTYHGFYGGTSLQSQELNELQENIQNQLSIANTLIGNWLEYDNNINIHGEPDGGIYDVGGGALDVFVPIDPENIIDGSFDTTNNWYLYKDDYGYEQFIRLQDENISHHDYYTRIKRRIISGYDPNWTILRDTNNTTTFDGTGAHRIQLYYPYSSGGGGGGIPAAQTVTDYEVWALHWPTYPDMFSAESRFAIDYYGPGVTGQLESGIGATFGDTFTNAAGDLQYRFKFLSLAPSLQAPASSVGLWNGWNPPGDGYTYDSTGPGIYSWNYFKDNIKKVPESKRMIQGRPWEGGNFFSASRWGYNDYYTKSADGTTYEGLRFATPWADVAAIDTQISVKRFLTACKNDNLKFSYFTTDQEQSHLPWHFRKGFNVYNNGGATAQESPPMLQVPGTLQM